MAEIAYRICSDKTFFDFITKFCKTTYLQGDYAHFVAETAPKGRPSESLPNQNMMRTPDGRNFAKTKPNLYHYLRREGTYSNMTFRSKKASTIIKDRNVHHGPFNSTIIDLFIKFMESFHSTLSIDTSPNTDYMREMYKALTDKSKAYQLFLDQQRQREQQARERREEVAIAEKELREYEQQQQQQEQDKLKTAKQLKQREKQKATYEQEQRRLRALGVPCTEQLTSATTQLRTIEVILFQRERQIEKLQKERTSHNHLIQGQLQTIAKLKREIQGLEQKSSSNFNHINNLRTELEEAKMSKAHEELELVRTELSTSKEESAKKDEQQELCLSILEAEIKRLQDLSKLNIDKLNLLIGTLQEQLTTRNTNHREHFLFVQQHTQNLQQHIHKLELQISQSVHQESAEFTRLKEAHSRLIEELRMIEKNRNYLEHQVSTFDNQTALLDSTHAHAINKLKEQAESARAQSVHFQSELEGKLRETEEYAAKHLANQEAQTALEDRIRKLESSRNTETTKKDQELASIQLKLGKLKEDQSRSATELDRKQGELERLRTEFSAQAKAADSTAREADKKLRAELAEALRKAQQTQQTHLGQLEHIKLQYEGFFDLIQNRMKELVGLWNDSTKNLEDKLDYEFTQLQIKHKDITAALQKQYSRIDRQVFNTLQDNAVSIAEAAFQCLKEVHCKIEHYLAFHITPQVIGQCINLSLLWKGPNFEHVKAALIDDKDGKCSDPKCSLKIDDYTIPIREIRGIETYCCELYPTEETLDLGSLITEMSNVSSEVSNEEILRRYSHKFRLVCFSCDRIHKEHQIAIKEVP